MFDGRFRTPIERAIRPVGLLLRRTGMSPDHLTILGILFAIAAAFAIAQGALRGGLIWSLQQLCRIFWMELLPKRQTLQVNEVLSLTQ